MKELKYTKNSKFEIIFENLNEVKDNRNYILYCKDLETIMYFPNIDKRYNLFIPYFPTTIFEELSCLMKKKSHNGCQIYTLDNENSKFENITNILTKWNIPEDNAVLFLSEKGRIKYGDLCKNRLSIFCGDKILCSGSESLKQWIDHYKIQTISLITTELHAESKNCPYHIENINKVCKELKEKYGVERVELFVSHCFVNYKNEIKDVYNAGLEYDYYSLDYLLYLKYIDKITTTNSTGILEVQKSNRLEVIDVVEFFKD